MSVKITATSTCDLPAQLLERYQITMVPLYVSFGGGTAAHWNTRVRRNEISAEVRPSFRAVKKEEPKMASPENKKVYNAQLMAKAGEDGVAAYGVLMYVSLVFQAIFIGYSTGGCKRAAPAQ